MDGLDDEGLCVDRADGFIWVRCAFDGGWGPEITLRDETFFDTLARRLGKRDAEVYYDDAFDARFWLSGYSNTLCQAVAKSAFEEHMLALPRGIVLRADGKVAHLRLPPDAGAHVAGAIAALRALCSISLRWLAPFREIPDADFVPASGPWNARERAYVRVRRHGVTAEATVSLYLEMSAPPWREGPFFSLTSTDGVLDGELPVEWMDSEVIEAVRALPGVCSLSGLQSVPRVTLHGEMDAKRADAACEVVTLLARPPTRGPYR